MQRILVMLAVSLGVAVGMGGTVVAGDARAAAKAQPLVAKEMETAKPQPKFHVVASGDSLSSIAEAEGLESWRPLWDANTEVVEPDLIYADQKLIVPVGPTVERPLPASAAKMPPLPVKTAQTARRTVVNYAPGTPGVLERIRLRESGGNYAINTGNGYYGAYQFSLGTWRGVGGTGLPSEASPAEQDMRAQMLYDRRGCNPWPNTCY